ncbi:unnamed protein product [Prorocentrum cordatum]|uniref:Uncharacterized protein n=1 Tax=Prorocentrum cordatum TaxID=2364126 RepID=A0ABN9XGW1_9DINO|nr:unnamed protein product [Polarella glacialis]
MCKATPFLDGSQRDEHLPAAQRGLGWSCVQASPDSYRAEAVDAGPPDYLVADSDLLELWALLQALCFSLPGTIFYSGSAFVVDGIERGPRQCCSSTATWAEVWRVVWQKLLTGGADSVAVVKVRGHATRAAVQAVQVDPFH